MDQQFSREEIAKGVFFSSFRNSRFKSNQIDVSFIDRLSEESASANAFFPLILSRSSVDHPTMRALNRRLSALYSAGIWDHVGKSGDIQQFGLCGTALDDVYALEGEKILSELAELLCGCLFRPVLEDGIFPEKNFEVYQQLLIDMNDAEINDKATYAYRRGTEETYRGEPAAVCVYGKNEDIRALTPRSAYRTYTEALRTKNIEILCVGRSDFAEVKERFRAAFGEIGRDPLPRPENRPSLLKTEPISVVQPMEVAQSKLVLSLKADIKDRHAALMMCDLFGGGITSKLFTVVREKLSLCYYCAASLEAEKGTMTVQSGIEAENAEKAKEEILRQLGEIQNGSFSDEELIKIKTALENNYGAWYDTVNNASNWYMARILENDIETPEERLKKLLAVTREEIVEAARSFRLDTTYILAPGKENA
ncbi:MAG: insulinase family protein [Bacteroides sp.]|nr:insulinase family protein [Eubacterium sp.]MCM1417450.1 insulinase family protein [Roseburia sp.]MCM1461630.1 insulinase family protein [Bacteroides sp.]